MPINSAGCVRALGAGMTSSSATDYGSPDLEGWPWQNIYPCPITGCWLYVGDVFLGQTLCCQPACCNPSHQVGSGAALTWPF